MKTLILAVQSALRSGLTYVRDNDIYIARHENIIPAGVRPPCIGVKDGPIRRIELAGGMMGYVMQVKIAAYVQLMQDEASILGDAADNKGILAVVDDLHTILDENLLDLGLQSAYSPSEEESEWFGDGQLTMQRKVIIYEYEKEGTRP